jgi:hypothetical protein
MNINRINTYQNTYITFDGKNKKKKANKKEKRQETLPQQPISNALYSLPNFDKQPKGKMSLTDAINKRQAEEFAKSYSDYQLNLDA